MFLSCSPKLRELLVEHAKSVTIYGHNVQSKHICSFTFVYLTSYFLVPFSDELMIFLVAVASELRINITARIFFRHFGTKRSLKLQAP